MASAADFETAVWRRAHRLARARVESSLPMSLGEVQAEKDQLRASYALSARRLELQLADLKETSSAQSIAASRYKADIAALTIDQGEKAYAGIPMAQMERERDDTQIALLHARAQVAKKSQG